MSKKHVEANKRRWAKIPKEERSRRMREVVLARHSKLTKKQRKEIGIKLTQSRLKKLREKAGGST